MNKLQTLGLFSLSLTLTIILSLVIVGGLNNNTQELVIVFEYPGPFEIVQTHSGVTDVIPCFGYKEVLISRIVPESWDTHFYTTRRDLNDAPMYIYVKTIDGETLESLVLVGHESVLNIDCQEVCRLN